MEITVGMKIRSYDFLGVKDAFVVPVAEETCKQAHPKFGVYMTTTVTIEAHCPEGVEVVVTTTGCQCGTNGDVVLQDGEKHSTVVYDNKSVQVSERKK